MQILYEPAIYSLDGKLIFNYIIATMFYRFCQLQTI